jgi:hypothetical protein
MSVPLACYTFSISIVAPMHRGNATRDAQDEEVCLKLPTSCILSDAISEVSEHLASSPFKDNSNFSNHVIGMSCNGIAISKHLMSSSLSQIEDNKTPIHLLPIYIKVKSPLSGPDNEFPSCVARKSLKIDDDGTDNPSLVGSLAVDLSSSPPINGNLHSPSLKSINSGSVLTSISTLTSPDMSTTFVQLCCPHIGVSTKFHQFMVSVNEHFSDLLHRVLDHHEKEERLSSLMVSGVHSSSVAVSYFSSSQPKSESIIQSCLEYPCEALFISRNWFVRFKSDVQMFSRPRVILTGDQVTNFLMGSGNQKMFPKRKELKTQEGPSKANYMQSIHNFIIDMLENDGLGVNHSSLSILTNLVVSLREIIWKGLPPSIPKYKIPQRFHHDIKRFNNRDRASYTQDSLSSLASHFLSSMSSAGFLATNKWASFHDDCKNLHKVVTEEIDDMRRRSKKMSFLYQTESASISSKLRGRRNIESLPLTKKIAPCYIKLTTLLSERGDFSHVMVTHTDIDNWSTSPGQVNESFTNVRMRRLRFRDEFRTRFPCASIQHHPGGRLPIIWVLWKISPVTTVDKLQRERELLEMKCHAEVVEALPRCTSRLQWSNFTDMYGDVLGGGVPSGMLRSLYRYLTKDVAAHPNTEQEQMVLLYVLSKGDPGLWPDLRASLNGVKEKYTLFYQVAEQVIESVTCASAYRHGTHRVLDSSNASLVSTKALHEKIVKAMTNSRDESIRNAEIPSEKLLAISLCPQYSSRATARHFSGRFSLSRGIQKATMRKSNIDAHYNHKLNQYGNTLIVEINRRVYDYYQGLPEPCGNGIVLSLGGIKISVDDKAAVPVGEPGHPVRTNVRKKNSSLDGGKISNAIDHDFHRANIRPSMALYIRTPVDIKDSWRNGLVTACLKDGCTQHSTPIRHAVELCNQIGALVLRDDRLIGDDFPIGITTSLPFGFLLRPDGGGDRNPKHALVQISMVYTFSRLNADFLIVLITAPDTSACNEVEGVMPVANLALQNQAYARSLMSPAYEKLYKGAQSGKAVRQRIAASGGISETENAKNAWRTSINPVRKIVGDRFVNMLYCEHKVKVFEPATDDDLDEVWEYLQENIDKELIPTRTTWAEVQKSCPDFMAFRKKHIYQGRYHLEIRKCRSAVCNVCEPIRMPPEIWEDLEKRPNLIPNPTPIESEQGHGETTRYTGYDELKYVQTKPNHRPSYTPPTSASASAGVRDTEVSESSRLFIADSGIKVQKSLWHSNNVWSILKCDDCSRPRVIFHWPLRIKESRRQMKEDLEGVLSEPSYEYMCGNNLFGLDEDQFSHPDSTAGFHVRTALTCGMGIEKAYYTATTAKLPPICSFCGNDSNLASPEVVQQVLADKKCRPLCTLCIDKGKKPVTYGNIVAMKKSGERKKGWKVGTAQAKLPNNTDQGDVPNKIRKGHVKTAVTKAVRKVASEEEKPEQAIANTANNLEIGMVSMKEKNTGQNTDAKAKGAALVQLVVKEKSTSIANNSISMIAQQDKGTMRERAPTNDLDNKKRKLNNFFGQKGGTTTKGGDEETTSVLRISSFWDFVDSQGVAVDVPADGNCGYYALQKGLLECGRTFENNITSFRKDLRMFALGEETSIMKSLCLSFKNKNEKEKLLWWHRDVLDRIYCQDENYDGGIGFNSWFDTNYLLPIALLRFELKAMAVYTLGNDGNHSSSIVYIGKDSRLFECDNNYRSLTPITESDSVMLIHVSGNHYQYLKPTKE